VFSKEESFVNAPVVYVVFVCISVRVMLMLLELIAW